LNLLEEFRSQFVSLELDQERKADRQYLHILN